MLNDLKQLVHLDPELEQRQGISQGVRIGPFIQVGQTFPLTPEGEIAFQDDIYWQCRLAIDTAVDVYLAAGGLRDHISLVRLYLKPAVNIESIDKAIFDCLGQVRPALTKVFVNQFEYPDCQVSAELTGVAVNYTPEQQS